MRSAATLTEPMYPSERISSSRHHSRCRDNRRRALAITLVVALSGALSGALGCAARGSSTAATGSIASTAQPARPYLVVVSLDAFRHDYLDRYHPQALEQLAAEGIRASALVPPFPSKTFPSHYTIATGLYPGHHGIVGNNFYDSQRDRWFRVKDATTLRDGSWYGGEPIWITAEREGVKSAVYFWPGSEAEVHGARPSYYKTFLGSVPDSERVDASIAWLRLPSAQRPHLVMMYLNSGDDTTHRYGPESPHTALAVAVLNRAVQRLRDGIASLPQRDSVNLVVLSDHGMADAPQEKIIAVLPLLAAEGVDTSRVRTGDIGPSMALWFGGDDALRDRALLALSKRLPNAHVYARGATPARWHLDGNPRAGDLIVVGKLGYVIAARPTDRWLDRGSHGWDPAYDEMHGIFIAAGPQVRRAGKIPAFDNVNVFPFLAALLGLEHPPRTDADARVLASFIRATPTD
ncbi:MAG: type phosphodiesterase/nucleotide pyrophosphatase [Gemmatimonadetes bacterium]|nr:type phosphodiesterase/nucleotide pyrophosphatase [Gemmatimonadota bacterium]